MKVSVDGILNTARRLKGQNYLEEESLKHKKEKIGKDSVEISKKLNSRLLTIQKELNIIQSSLTKNQIIREGIRLLSDDLSTGGKNQEKILNELTFENEKVLSRYVGENPVKIDLNEKAKTIDISINNDTSSLKRLQVEVENILASNLAGSANRDVFQDIDKIISSTDSISLKNISDLRPESVMSLIN